MPHLGDDHYPGGAVTDEPDELPPGLSRRQFLEDVLDAMGDAGSIVLPDGTEVTRHELLTQLAEEMDR